MKAADLYEQMEKDFVKPDMVEDWYCHEMAVNAEFISENFKRRSMGLLCNFADEITKVYTAVFPSDRVLKKILDDGTTDAMIFLHHPMDWDLSKDVNVAFYQMSGGLLEKLKERRVALFNFHYPLDNYGVYSTSKTLAEAIGVEIEKPFAKLGGAFCGVIGTTECNSLDMIERRLSKAVEHETKLYRYGDEKIIDGRIAICAGGGNQVEVLKELIDEKISVLITGLTVNNKYSAAAHEFAQEKGISLIGGTHYSSEKFACIAMCSYFEELGLGCEFVADKPCLQDL